MKPIYFYRGIPSSFHRAPIMLYSDVLDRVVQFSDNEHYFQIAKLFICFGMREEAAYRLHEKMRLEMPRPQDVKDAGQRIPLSEKEVEIWDDRESAVAMLTCNLEKFRTHKYCHDWLRKTGTRSLVEHSRDRRWGDGMDGSGANRLGKTLELVRAVLC